jgi:single-stranded-DNA-specific exonuclease
MTPPNIYQEPIWVYPKKNSEWQDAIIKEFNIHPVTAQILVSRGFGSLEEIHDYLYGKLPNLFDPFLFNDMDKAVSRIITAIDNKEGIVIYGDNDVDGMTAAALLTEFFRHIGAEVRFYIPESTVQKKAVLSDALEYALKYNCSLMITVDCGITAATEIDHVVQHNVDVIITDHHEPTSRIPNCIATLNPKLVNSTYPNRNICGVGVAFKLAHAITNYLMDNKLTNKTIDLKRYLDLVALGTISDMGALVGENRILVRYGLNQLRKTKREGLIKLFQVCEVNVHKLLLMDVASKVAPRLNSLGRIADPKKGVELLLIRNEQAAQELAQELDLNNIERQKIEKIAAEQIDQEIAQNPDILQNKAIVLYSNNWHPGIIPIIAARITKHYNRPTMLIAIEKGIGKGSIRTIPEFPLLKILKENETLLINFGGHDFAAGLTIEEKNIEELKKNFIAKANQVLSDTDIQPKLYLDSEVDFNDLTFDFMESLNLLEPFGTENPVPLLYCNVTQTWAPKVVGQSHLKFYFEQQGKTLEGIGFNMAHRRHLLKRKNLLLKIAFTPHVNTFLNKTSIQLQIRDFQILE